MAHFRRFLDTSYTLPAHFLDTSCTHIGAPPGTTAHAAPAAIELASAHVNLERLLKGGKDVAAVVPMLDGKEV